MRRIRSSKKLKVSIIVLYFLFSLFIALLSLIWFYTELVYSRSPVNIYNRWKASISRPDSVIYIDSKMYIPENSIILGSSQQENYVKVEILYDRNYLIGCYLVPTMDYDFFLSTYLTLVEKIDFGDLAGRYYNFMFENDIVFMLYEIEDFYTESGIQYLMTAFFPEKKLYLIISGSDLDVAKSISIIKIMVYNNKDIDVYLISDFFPEYKS